MDSSEREQQHGVRLVLAIVAVLVVAAMALGAVLLNRGETDTTQAEVLQSATPAAEPGGEPDATAGAEDAGAPGTAGTTAEDAGTPPVAAPCPPPDDDVPDPTTSPYDEQPTVALGQATSVRATVITTCGTIVLELAAGAVPQTVGNFVALAEDGYYDGVGFHRVIDGFMIQGGDPTGTGAGCLDESCARRLPGYTFPDELGLAEDVVAQSGGYPRGTVAMANAGPDTNGSQFFIVQASPGYPLPPDYAVFGQVVEGMDVIDRIALGPVDGDLAIDPVVIRAVEVAR